MGIENTEWLELNDWMMVDRGLVWFTGVVSYTYLVGIRGFSGDCPSLSIEMGEWYAGQQTVHPSPSGRFWEAITSVNPASPVLPQGIWTSWPRRALPWWVAPPKKVMNQSRWPTSHSVMGTAWRIDAETSVECGGIRWDSVHQWC